LKQSHFKVITYLFAFVQCLP